MIVIPVGEHIHPCPVHPDYVVFNLMPLIP
jgi:hypothetical protein